MKLYFFIVLCLLLGIESLAQTDNPPIKSLKMIYWEVQSYPIGTGKYKKTLIFSDNKSKIQTNLVVPPGANDTTLLPGEKRETVIDKEGKTINKVVMSNAPKEPFVPKNIWLTFKDFQKKEFVTPEGILIYDGSGKSEYYLLKEPLPDFGWQITSERKKIGDFECMKAISKPFRGRVYEAWFAPEIAISDGPWKLCGLPGLILEAEDQSGEIRFVMEKIILNPTDITTVEDPHLERNLPFITWEQYKTKKNEQVDRMIKYNASKGVKTLDYKTYEIEKTR